MSTAEIQDYRSLLDDPPSRRYETFSYLPELDAAAIRKQIQAMLDQGWDVAIEHIEPERSHKTYWYMWKLPLFGQGKISTPAGTLTPGTTSR